MSLLTLNVNKIKGVADKNGNVEGTWKRTFNISVGISNKNVDLQRK